MIDKTGTWWKGESFEDLAEYLIGLTAENYPAKEIRQCLCECGNNKFRIATDNRESFTQRECTECGKKAYLADSEEFVKEAKPTEFSCAVCKNDTFELGLAFSFRGKKSLKDIFKKKEIKWITEGELCTKCGVLGSNNDWKINYAPSRHLLDNV